MESLSSVAVQPDPSGARVVLIGASKYDTMEDLPAVEHNLGGLRDLLTAPDIWGLPPEHCTVVLNPAFAVEAMEALHTAAAAATSALVVYFAGHGLLDTKGDLYLVPGGADHQRIFRGIRYDDVRRELLDTASCPAKIVILDCCYSGRALEGRQSGPGGLASEAVIEGTFVMTASARDKPAWAPPGERYTAFSGALIECIETGLDLQADLLNMDTLFLHARQRLKGRNLSVPEQRSRDAGRFIALARNRRGPSTMPPPSPAPESPPSRPLVPAVPMPRPAPPVPAADLVSAADLPRPAKLAAEVAALRAAGRDTDADALLVEAGALQSDQGTAALIEVLRDAGRVGDLRHVVNGAALRRPEEIVDVVDALRVIELHDDAREVLAAVGRRPADEAASVAATLRDLHATADLATVIDAALATALKYQSIITLIEALWLAGFRSEVDALLVGAANDLDQLAAADVADELRAAGRQDAAFKLYAVAAPAVITRPATAVAELIVVMLAAGDTGHGDHLAATAIAAVHSPDAAVDLVQALHAADLTGYLGLLVAHLAATLPTAAMIETADRLFEQHLDAPALALLTAAAVDADSVVAAVALLSQVGRRGDARRLLQTAGQQLDPVETARLVSARGIPARDADSLLGVVAARAPADLVALVERLVQDDAVDVAVRCCAAFLAGPTQRVIEALVVLERSPDRRGLDVVARAMLDPSAPDRTATLLAELRPAVSRPILRQLISTGGTEEILRAVRERSGQDSAGDPVLTLLIGRSPAERWGARDAPVSSVLSALETLAGGGLQQEATMLARLVIESQTAVVAETLLTESLTLDTDATLLPLLRAALDLRASVLVNLIGSVPPLLWQRMNARLTTLPTEQVLALAELIEGPPRRLVELLYPHVRARTVPADAVTGSSGVLAALIALGVPGPRLDWRVLRLRSWESSPFAGFAAVVRALEQAKGRSTAEWVLRRLGSRSVSCLFEGLFEADQQMFHHLVRSMADAPGGAAGLDLPAVLAGQSAPLVAAAIQHLADTGHTGAADLIATVRRELTAPRQLLIATDLHRLGKPLLAAQVMAVDVWPAVAPGTVVALSDLFIFDAVCGIGPLAASCSYGWSDERRLKQVQRRARLGDQPVLYVIGSGTPMVVFTYHELVHVRAGRLARPTRLPYAELATAEVVPLDEGRLEVRRPGVPTEIWDLSRTGVTAAQVIGLLDRVGQALARASA